MTGFDNYLKHHNAITSPNLYKRYYNESLAQVLNHFDSRINQCDNGHKPLKIYNTRSLPKFSYKI